MPTLSLPAFLNIVSKGTPQKATSYGRYLSPGNGYDFYWRLKDAAEALTVKGQPFDLCIQPLNAIKREAERKHNVEGLRSLQKILAKLDATYFASPEGRCSSPGNHLTVKLRPEFGLVKDGKRQLVQLWPSQAPGLTQTTAAIGIYLLKQHLAVGEYADCSCSILDLRRKRSYVADAIPPGVPAMVASEFAWADSFFGQQAKAA